MNCLGEQARVQPGVLAAGIGGLSILNPRRIFPFRSLGVFHCFQLIKRKGDLSVFDFHPIPEGNGIIGVACQIDGVIDRSGINWEKAFQIGAAMLTGAEQNHFSGGINITILISCEIVQVVIIPGVGVLVVCGQLILIGIAGVFCVNAFMPHRGNGHNAAARSVNGFAHQLVEIITGHAHRDIAESIGAERITFPGLADFQIEGFVFGVIGVLPIAADADQQTAGAVIIGTASKGGIGNGKAAGVFQIFAFSTAGFVSNDPVAAAAVYQPAELGCSSGKRTIRNGYTVELDFLAFPTIAQ